MTREDMDAVVAWMESQWPTMGWNAATIRNLFDQIKGLAPDDVWGGLYGLYDEGREFAPTPSQIVAAIRMHAISYSGGTWTWCAARSSVGWLRICDRASTRPMSSRKL